jgi:HTH-type transcriptional regulator/antitoxin HipB
VSKRVRTIKDAANAIRGRRLELGLSQSELARRAEVSRKWVNEFEAGKPSAELHLVMRVMDAVGLRLVVDSDPDADPGTGIDLDALLVEHAER